MVLLIDSLVVLGLATISLGTIQEADGVQSRSFWLQNTGSQPVELLQGYTSCGCTTIQFDNRQAVASGDSTCITLRFNPQGKGGEFEETGTIVYGQQRKRVRLSMTGTCVTSEETLMRQFPIRISDNLRLSTNRFDLGVMHVGDTRERGVIILHRNEDNRQERIPIRFTVDAKSPKGLQHITYPIQTREKDQEVTIVITLDVMIK